MRLACFIVAISISSSAIAAPTATPIPQTGIVTDAYRVASIFDTDPAAVRGELLLGLGGTAGDCAISADGRRGYVTDFHHNLWVVDLTSVPPQLAPGINPIVISNPGEDVSATADGRFLVICDGGTLTPVSVVDTQSRMEVDTLSLGASCNSVDVCSTGSVLVTSHTGTVRRLVIDAAGQLSNTGESMSVPDGARNVVCSPDGAAGVVVRSTDSIRSFRIPGLIPVTDRVISQYGRSGAMALDGTRFYVRSYDTIDAFDFDSVTGELGAAPVFSVSVGPSLQYYGVDQLAVDLTGTRLYAPEPHRLAAFDSVTGASLPALVLPDLVESGGICLGPRGADECVVSACDDGNPCTDDACDGSGCLNVPNAESCGDPEDCSVSHVCSQGACVETAPPDCDAPCPPGFTEDESFCRKTYDIDASLLDNLSDSCDGTGANRFNCEGVPYGFHWTDLGGDGVGEVWQVVVDLVGGRNCAGGLREFELNGTGIATFDIPADCSCSPGHTPRSLYGASSYVKDGVNTLSIVATEDCEGLSAAPILDGLFGRVTVWFSRRDPNCLTATCNSSTHRCEYTFQDCHDSDPCTEDTCDGQGGCVHTVSQDFPPCEDGQFCNGFEYCHGDGSCYADYGPCLDDGNVCTVDYCDPFWGCVSDVAPEGTSCFDGDPCTTDDACSGPACVGDPPPQPPEVSGVAISHPGGTVVSWVALEEDIHYDIASSSLLVLRSSGPNAASCLLNNVAGFATNDDRPDPPAGDGYFYMVRGQTTCAAGTYGSTSAGTERLPAAACP